MRTSLRATGLIIAAALSFPLLAHAGDSKDITVSNPWVRATPGGAKITAAFMEIKSEAGDKLLAAKSDVAGRVEVHTHIMEGDVMKMRRVESLDVGKGASRLLKPMGDHIMLMDLKGPLKEGDTVTMTLTFEKAGDVAVTAPVEAAGAMGAKGAKTDSKAGGDHQHHEHHGAH